MRFSFLRTLLFLLPVLLLLSCSGQATQKPLTPSNAKAHTAPSVTVDDQVPGAEASGNLSLPEHLLVALSYEGTTELTGRNDGPDIEQFLKAVHLNAGNPYCAAFVSYCLDQSQGVIKPKVRSALASDFILDYSIPARKVLRGTVPDPAPGTILIWQKGNTIFGHTGFVISWEKDSGTTIEANTSAGVYGSQSDGEGVYRRNRSIQPANYFRITTFTPVIYARQN